MRFMVYAGDVKFFTKTEHAGRNISCVILLVPRAENASSPSFSRCWSVTLNRLVKAQD